MDKDAEILLLVSGCSFFFFYGLDNQHRQIGPVEHRLRHRAHQRALQRAHAPGTDDEHAGVKAFGQIQQLGGRFAQGDFAGKGHASGLRQGFGAGQ